MTRLSVLLVSLLITAGVVTPARSQWAVIDVGAITQLITQLQTMRNQLVTAQSQLTQARSTLESMSGGRGMQNLLSGTVRNYLPSDWQQLADVMQSASSSYSALGREVQQVLDGNAILSGGDLSRLTPAQRSLIEQSRRTAATLDVLTRGALANTSGRFAAIQSLIGAIGGANDQKAILDLQARIAAEQGMLQNEATKLDVLYEAANAQERERQQRVREQAIADVGSLRTLPAMGLPIATSP